MNMIDSYKIRIKDVKTAQDFASMLLDFELSFDTWFDTQSGEYCFKTDKKEQDIVTGLLNMAKRNTQEKPT